MVLPWRCSLSCLPKSGSADPSTNLGPDFRLPSDSHVTFTIPKLLNAHVPELTARCSAAGPHVL